MALNLVIKRACTHHRALQYRVLTRQNQAWHYHIEGHFLSVCWEQIQDLLEVGEDIVLQNHEGFFQGVTPPHGTNLSLHLPRFERDGDGSSRH